MNMALPDASQAVLIFTVDLTPEALPEEIELVF